jgi:hypothetical protein
VRQAHIPHIGLIIINIIIISNSSNMRMVSSQLQIHRILINIQKEDKAWNKAEILGKLPTQDEFTIIERMTGSMIDIPLRRKFLGLWLAWTNLRLVFRLAVKARKQTFSASDVRVAGKNLRLELYVFISNSSSMFHVNHLFKKL